MTRHRIFTTKIWIFLIIIALVAEYVLISNVSGGQDITEPIKDKAHKAVMENAFEDFCPTEEEAPEDICPAEMQEEETQNDGIYILIQTKNHNFEMNL